MQQIEKARAAFDRESQEASEFGIVARDGMRVERQVVREKIQSALDHGAQATLLQAHNRARLALPEPAVMHEQRIGADRACLLDEFKRRRDTEGHNFTSSDPSTCKPFGA